LAFNRHPVVLGSDAGATFHVTLRVSTDGSLSVLRGPATGGVIAGPTAAGLVAVNTWVFLELQATLSDTVGTAVVRINGTQVINATGLDTKNAGTKTVFDSVDLVPPGTSA